MGDSREVKKRARFAGSVVACDRGTVDTKNLVARDVLGGSPSRRQPNLKEAPRSAFEVMCR